MERKERIVAIGKPNNDITYDWKSIGMSLSNPVAYAMHIVEKKIIKQIEKHNIEMANKYYKQIK